MRLRVLGACGGWPAAGLACSGYLVGDGETLVWLDAGAGTLAELLLHATLPDLGALWISHLHPDHCSDLGLVRNALAYGRGRGDRTLPVLGPPGWRAWFDMAVPDAAATLAVFETREHRDRGEIAIGGLRLTPFAVRHGIPTFGCRVESDRGVLAYSADSGPSDALVELARGADLFVCEAYLSLPDAGESATVMTPEQAGAIASAARVRRLLLTHLHPDADPAAAVVRAGATYAGPVSVAQQGAAYDVAMFGADPPAG
jgi:ribonuclease BN (tRNA processing enzyme)